MGCDYYIYVYLEIEHARGTSYYKLEEIRGHFCELNASHYDSDDEEKDRYYYSDDYKEMERLSKKIALTPRKDVVVFCDGAFTSPRFAEKYEPHLRKKIERQYTEGYCLYKDTSPFCDMADLVKVTKKEIRYEPGMGNGVKWIYLGDTSADETSDEDMFKAVEKFAAKYGMRVLTNDLGDIIRKKTPEEKEQYVIFHEWTDGDQITFFVMKFGDICRAYNKNTCAAAVDDWEENRPALICKRLLRECIKHGIILADPENM